MRLGILSTAHINRRVVSAAHASPCVEVVAIASRDHARAEAFAREWSIERAYGSYDALLADDDLDAIYVSLPNSLHIEWSIRAAKAGKHVLCEKPLDRRPNRVKQAFDAADRAGVILTEGFMYRHHAQTRRLVDLVASGVIGELEFIRAAFAYRLTDSANARLRPELDGGALMDVGCYCVSAARLLAGEPERAYGEQVLGPTGVDLRFHGTLRFPRGILAHFDAGLTTNLSELTVIGSEGTMTVYDPWHCRQPRIELQRIDAQLETIHFDTADSYQLELEDLAAAMTGQSPPLLGRTDAIAQAQVLSLLHRSASADRAFPVIAPAIM